jgi:hypothetical protein
VVLRLGFFMIMLDTTIVSIALPATLKGLNASLDQILWVFNGYLVDWLRRTRRFADRPQQQLELCSRNLDFGTYRAGQLLAREGASRAPST